MAIERPGNLPISREMKDDEIAKSARLRAPLTISSCGDCRHRSVLWSNAVPTSGSGRWLLKSQITRVQPMTGIVLWTTSEHKSTDAVQLEYSYMKYGDVVTGRDQYDWRVMDRLLEDVASRKHQAIVRFYFVYPGQRRPSQPISRPSADYHELPSKSEGKPTTFADWSHPELKRFTLAFYEKLAERYDQDPRLAFPRDGFRPLG